MSHVCFFFSHSWSTGGDRFHLATYEYLQSSNLLVATCSMFRIVFSQAGLALSDDDLDFVVSHTGKVRLDGSAIAGWWLPPSIFTSRYSSILRNFQSFSGWPGAPISNLKSRPAFTCITYCTVNSLLTAWFFCLRSQYPFLSQLVVLFLDNDGEEMWTRRP